MKELDIAFLHSVLRYDAVTGILTWIKTKYPERLGQEAGGFNSKGYRRIELRGVFYSSHRIAWAMYYGVWPDRHIDHVNGIRRDNRICNLRLCDFAGNRSNSRLNTNNTSGYRGVVLKWPWREKPWRAQIKHLGKQIYIGAFATPKEAHAAYAKKAAELHGEFFNPSLAAAGSAGS